MLEILEYLHSNGIVYRDLKPGNLMVTSPSASGTKHSRVILVDFGIARLFTPGKSVDTVVVGTPGFASPEHYGRGQTDERSDIYSMGATLHQMLTGIDPADAPFSFRPPVEALPGLSTAISDIVMCALDLQPAKRFSTASRMRLAIVNSRKTPPPVRSFRYPFYVGIARPLITGGLTGTFIGGIAGAAVNWHVALLFPAWIGAIGVAGLVRGWSRRRFRIDLDSDGLQFVEGGSTTIARWEDIEEVRVHRTSGLDRTLWGEVLVYPSTINVLLRGNVHVQFLPQLEGWETLLEWLVYRAGLRLQKGGIEGADEVYTR